MTPEIDLCHTAAKALDILNHGELSSLTTARIILYLCPDRPKDKDARTLERFGTTHHGECQCEVCGEGK